MDMRTRTWLIMWGVLGVGCASAPPPPPVIDDPSLTLVEGREVRLRTDLPPSEAERVLARLETIEGAISVQVGFLELGDPPPLTFVVADPARFALLARDAGVSAERAGAIACAGGELLVRYREEEWAEGVVGGVGLPLEPRVRPLAAGALRRRLVVEYGPNLPPSWLEQGLAAAFADVAAGLVGEGGLVVAQSRRRLLDAYLPLYLGAEPLIWEVLRLGEAPGREWSRAQGWAVARWLLREPTHRALIDQAFLRAKGELSDEAWEGVRVQALALERAFEEDLRVEVLRGLLEGMRAATRPVDRWEWTDAMRLLANIDVDADAEQAVFVQLVEGTARLLDEDPGTTRFLDAYEGQLRTLVDARSKLQGMRRLKRQVVAELERRGQGYGHPALEEGKGSMGQALQRRFEELGGR